MLRIGFLALVAASALAMPTLAAEYPKGESHAVLVKAAPAGTEVVVDGRIWRCDGVACVALANDSDLHNKPVVECRNAARTLGKFSAYSTGKITLTDAQLAECMP
jgi:hypothetical protein